MHAMEAFCEMMATEVGRKLEARQSQQQLWASTAAPWSGQGGEDVELPEELLLKIVCHVLVTEGRDHPNAMATVIKLASVCSRWRQAIVDCPMFWKVFQRSGKKQLAFGAVVNGQWVANVDRCPQLLVQMDLLITSIARSQSNIVAIKLSVPELLAAGEALLLCTTIVEIDLRPTQGGQLWHSTTASLLRVFPEIKTAAAEQVLRKAIAVLTCFPQLKKLWLPPFLRMRPGWQAVQEQVAPTHALCCDGCLVQFPTDNLTIVYTCSGCTGVYCSKQHSFATFRQRMNMINLLADESNPIKPAAMLTGLEVCGLCGGGFCQYCEDFETCEACEVRCCTDHIMGCSGCHQTACDDCDLVHYCCLCDESFCDGKS
jgi:hypothetical protein